MKKKLLLLLAACICLSIFNISAPNVKAAGLSLAELQAKFPDGRFWNHDPNEGNNPDKTTSTPCTHHSPACDYYGNCGCNSFHGAIQCNGFANKLTYDYYGSTFVDCWSRTTDTSVIKAGDVICYVAGYSDGIPYNHYIWVTARSGDTITITDCNINKNCGIRWGKNLSISGLSAKPIKYIAQAPYALTESPSSGTTEVTEPPSNPSNLRSDKKIYNSSESITFYWDAAVGATAYWIYMWKDGVELYGTDMGNATSFTSAPTSPGNYTFIVRAGNSVGYSEGVSYSFIVTDVPVTNAWVKVDKYNVAINKEVVFTYHADNAEYYELWLFRNGICLGNTPLPLTGSYTTKFDTAGYYQAYISSSNSSGYIDSGKIEFNIYDNVPPDPWIYIEKDTLVVGEEVRFVYNASHVTHFSLGIDRYDERIASVHRDWNDTTYTTSFDKSGIYTAYVSAYNDYGYTDSRKITFTVRDETVQNLGQDFYGKILNKACWTPVQNDNSKLKLCKEKGHSNELWRFIKQTDGSYEIFSCTTGKNLLVYNDSTISIGNTTETINKQWFIYNFGNGIILKPKSSENVLTLDGGNIEFGTEIVLSPFSGNSSQIFNVYQGYDVQLTAPSLSIDAIKYNKVSFSWSSVSSLSNYKIKVYSVEDLNNPMYVDDVSIDTTSYTLKLPTGNYKATVTAYNYFEGLTSNEVEFSLTTPININVVKKENVLIFTSILNLNNAENSIVILGVYDKNHKLLYVKKDSYSESVSFELPYQNNIEYAKIFIWESIVTLKPVCEAEVIPKSEWIIE